MPSSDFPTDTEENFSIIFDTSAGDEGLKDAAGPLYAHSVELRLTERIGSTPQTGTLLLTNIG